MKRIAKIAGALVLSLIGISANAQSTHEVRVNVPFSFAVAGKTLPAGEYRLFFDPSTSLVTLQREQSMVLSSVTLPSERVDSQKTFLRFNATGQEHVLREISFEGNVRRLPSVRAMATLIASRSPEREGRPAAVQTATVATAGEN